MTEKPRQRLEAKETLQMLGASLGGPTSEELGPSESRNGNNGQAPLYLLAIHYWCKVWAQMTNQGRPWILPF